VYGVVRVDRLEAGHQQGLAVVAEQIRVRVVHLDERPVGLPYDDAVRIVFEESAVVGPGSLYAAIRSGVEDAIRQPPPLGIVAARQVVGDARGDGLARDGFASHPGPEYERSVGIADGLEQVEAGPIRQVVAADDTVDAVDPRKRLLDVGRCLDGKPDVWVPEFRRCARRECRIVDVENAYGIVHRRCRLQERVSEVKNYRARPIPSQTSSRVDADATACLLANHGLVAIGEDLDDAMETAIAVDSVALLSGAGNWGARAAPAGRIRPRRPEAGRPRPRWVTGESVKARDTLPLRMRTIEWDDDRDCIAMVDQTKLPSEYTTYHAETVPELIESIRRLRVRGAPALGAAGAYGVALAARRTDAADVDAFIEAVEADAEAIATARPTAVNLAREVEAALAELEACSSIPEARKRTLAHAEKLADADVARNRRLGDHGAALLDDGDTVLTHCNAGALATVDWGTALGVVYSAQEAGTDVRVVATETRPLNQGARITTVELQERDVDVTLVPDSASGLCMQEGRIDAVVVGADRVVLDGGDRFDGGVVFNKIGTYTHAVLADRHDVPFVVAAPHATVDAERSADEVEIEQRDPDELREIYGTQSAPPETDVYNPAFDATPMALVDYLVTETGVYEPPLDRDAFGAADEPARV